MGFEMSMRTYTTAILCLTVFFLFADQNLMAPNLSAIADDFGFNEEERDEKLGGYIAFGFFVVGGPVALLVGYFADTVNRCTLFGVVIALGESACLATYWVKTYPQLFVCRVLTGISIGGATPIIFSLLGDLYPGDSRIYVSTMVGVALGSGIAAGQLLAGIVGPDLGWRVPFIMVAVPAIICALLVFFTVREPKRGDQEHALKKLREKSKKDGKESPDNVITTVTEKNINKKYNYTEINNIESPVYNAVLSNEESKKGLDQEFLDDDDDEVLSVESIQYSEQIECHKVVQLFRTASVVIVFIQGLPGCLPWGMIYVFLNDYFSEDRGMTVQNATATLTGFGVGGLIGQFVGGWVGQILYNKDPRYQCALMGSSTILAVPPMLYLLNTPDVGGVWFYFMSFVAGVIVNVNGPNVRVVLQNVCIPEIRGTAFALFALTDDIGKGLGPAAVVLFIKMCNGNRREAFNIVVLFWLFCGTMLLLLIVTVKHDEDTVQKTVKESVLNNQEKQRDNINSSQLLIIRDDANPSIKSSLEGFQLQNKIKNSNSDYKLLPAAENNSTKKNGKLKQAS